MLIPEASEDFNLWPEEQDRRKLCARKREAVCAICLALDGWTPLEDVAIEHVGRKVFELYPIAREPDPNAAPTALTSLPCDVTLHSLSARPDLNGRRGRAISLDAPSGRYHVVLHDGGDTLALRVRNLRETPKPQRPQRVIVEVSLVNDQKRVAVLSTTRLRNSTAVHLDVRLERQPLTTGGFESVHPLAPGGMLPLPLRADGGSYRVCLRPSSGDQDWCAQTHVPSNAEAAPAVTVPLECPPAVPSAQTWHCLLHHSGSSSSASATAASSSSPGGSAVCELSVQPPMEVRNLLAGPLRFELLGSGVAHAKALNSGESLRTHAFAQGTAVSFSMAISGYGTSERQLVACPPSYDDEVLCRAVTLLDHSNQLDVKIHYEVGAGWCARSPSTRPTGSSTTRGCRSQCASLARCTASRATSPPWCARWCARTRRARPASTTTPEESLPFSDERMQRRHVSLSAVWLPPGWVWLDDAWDVDRETHDVDEQGWRYAHSFTPMLELGDMDSGWAGAQYFTSLVRQRRWFRHRALAAKMDAATAARLSDDAIGRMSANELRMTIASGGLGHRDCNSRDMLRARAKEARDAARDGGGGGAQEQGVAAAAAAAPARGQAAAAARHRFR